MAERRTPPSGAKAETPAAPAFLGPPGRLRWAGVTLRAAPKALHLPDALLPYADARHPLLRIGRDPARTRIRLAPNTPPGAYRIGIEYADGQTEPVEIEVEARARLRVVPGSLRLAGAPGETVAARLLLENRGNQAIEIGEALVAGLFDNGGIEAALAAMYRLESDDLERIVGTGFARLRAAHGGLLKMHVRQGAGRLAPADRRQLAIEAQLGSKLVAGHGYHGTLEFGGHRIAVLVDVLEPSPSSGARR